MCRIGNTGPCTWNVITGPARLERAGPPAEESSQGGEVSVERRRLDRAVASSETLYRAPGAAETPSGSTGECSPLQALETLHQEKYDGFVSAHANIFPPGS